MKNLSIDMPPRWGLLVLYLKLRELALKNQVRLNEKS